MKKQIEMLFLKNQPKECSASSDIKKLDFYGVEKSTPIFVY